MRNVPAKYFFQRLTFCEGLGFQRCFNRLPVLSWNSFRFGQGTTLITLATNIIGVCFLMRRRAWWADLKFFFATLFGIMHSVAGRVSVSFCQLFLKRFSKMLESGLEPMREKNGRSGDRTHPGVTNPCYSACVARVPGPGSPEPLLQRLCSKGSRPRESRTLATTPV